MENIDLTQTVPAETSSYLGAVGIIIISAILVLLFIFFKRYKARVVPLLMGILGYIVFLFIGYNAIVALIFAIPGVEQNYKNNPIILTVIYLVIFVAMFTTARIVITKIMYAKYDKPGDVLNFGLGLSLCDALLCTFSSMTLMIWASAINNSGMAELFKDFTETDMISAYNSISMLFTAPPIFWVLLGVSSVFDILLNCALAVLTYGVVSKKIPTWWYAASGGINFLVIAPFKFYDTSSTMGVLIPFAIKVVVFVAALFVINKMDTKYIGGLISFTGKDNIKPKKITGMPKFGNLSKK